LLRLVYFIRVSCMILIMQALRFFVGEPIWTPYNRPHDHLPARYDLTSLVISSSIWDNQIIYVEPHNAISMRRGQYIKTFVEKDVANHAVDATA
jgi:1,2-dihydroxy-3-keto-5-methylthiopentene dioxygenase